MQHKLSTHVTGRIIYSINNIVYVIRFEQAQIMYDKRNSAPMTNSLANAIDRVYMSTLSILGILTIVYVKVGFRISRSCIYKLGNRILILEKETCDKYTELWM